MEAPRASMAVQCICAFCPTARNSYVSSERARKSLELRSRPHLPEKSRSESAAESGVTAPSASMAAITGRAICNMAIVTLNHILAPGPNSIHFNRNDRPGGLSYRTLDNGGVQELQI